MILGYSVHMIYKDSIRLDHSTIAGKRDLLLLNRTVRSLLPPVSITRFPSFRTQPLENLSVDSVKNGFLSNPAPGENLARGNLVMETGCTCPGAEREMGCDNQTTAYLEGPNRSSDKALIISPTQKCKVERDTANLPTKIWISEALTQA